MTKSTITMPCTFDVFIPFHLADPAGILFFAHVLTLTHQVYEQFVIEKLKMNWEEWFQHPDFIIPVKETATRYHTPLYAGQNCQIKIDIKNLTRVSFTLTAHFFQKSLCCEVSITHLFCRRSPMQAMTIPDVIRQKLHEFI